MNTISYEWVYKWICSRKNALSNEYKLSDEKAFQRMFFHLNELANEYILIGLMIQVSNDWAFESIF